MKGFCALGDSSLRKKFQHLKKDPDNVELKSVLHPDDIIKRLKGDINDPLTCNTGITEQEIKTEENQTEPGIGTNAENNERIKIKADSQLSLAGDIINDKDITLVPEMGGFMVKGKCGKLYAVKLFPKESCQCPSGSTGRCYHILAAKKSINMPTDQKPKTVNLTQLRK